MPSSSSDAGFGAASYNRSTEMTVVLDSNGSQLSERGVVSTDLIVCEEVERIEWRSMADGLAGLVFVLSSRALALVSCMLCVGLCSC